MGIGNSIIDMKINTKINIEKESTIENKYRITLQSLDNNQDDCVEHFYDMINIFVDNYKNEVNDIASFKKDLKMILHVINIMILDGNVLQDMNDEYKSYPDDLLLQEINDLTEFKNSIDYLHNNIESCDITHDKKINDEAFREACTNCVTYLGKKAEAMSSFADDLKELNGKLEQTVDMLQKLHPGIHIPSEFNEQMPECLIDEMNESLKEGKLPDKMKVDFDEESIKKFQENVDNMEILDLENIPENSEIVEVVNVEPNENTNIQELISNLNDK
jgi:hypothetical protein